MIGLLVKKDLIRAWHNPLPWLIFLVMPMVITALIGLAFGGRQESNLLGKIRFAVVDENKSPFIDFLRGSLNQRDAAQYLEPVFLEREEALVQLRQNKISAVLVLPKDMAQNYLSGSQPVTIELIKNPTQAWHPAIIEEVSGLLTTCLNALRQTLGDELKQWQDIFEGKGDYRKYAELVLRSGDRYESVRKFLDPPLIWVDRETRKSVEKKGPDINIFGYLLIGMAGMFLLFIACTAITDVHREIKQGTVARFYTMRHSMFIFIASKVCFTWVLMILCALILLLGGGIAFGVHWKHPAILLAFLASYCFFVVGFMSLLTALIHNQERADALNNIISMLLGVAGGCAFPPEQLPALFRDHITPIIPTHWFVNTARNLEYAAMPPSWLGYFGMMILLGIILTAIAAFLFRKRLEKGVRP
jgi:ABC-type multidrug transport system permease subunit